HDDLPDVMSTGRRPPGGLLRRDPPHRTSQRRPVPRLVVVRLVDDLQQLANLALPHAMDTCPPTPDLRQLNCNIRPPVCSGLAGSGPYLHADVFVPEAGIRLDE